MNETLDKQDKGYPVLPLIDGDRVIAMQKRMKVVYANDLVVVVKDMDSGMRFYVPRPR